MDSKHNAKVALQATLGGSGRQIAYSSSSTSAGGFLYDSSVKSSP